LLLCFPLIHTFIESIDGMPIRSRDPVADATAFAVLVSLAAPFVKFRETMKEIKNRIREGIVQQDLDDLGRRDS
jgi:hypothetical protein